MDTLKQVGIWYFQVGWLIVTALGVPLAFWADSRAGTRGVISVACAILALGMFMLWAKHS